MISKDKNKIAEFLTRSVEAIYPSKAEFEKALNSGKKLRMYLGVDPSGAKLHIGHSVPLFVLKRFHELGHEVILLIGSFTAQLGDPTGKAESRKPKTKEEVLENAKKYKEQVAGILNFADKKNPIQIKYNHEWLENMTFADVIKLASNFTAQQMIQRDMFQERIKNEQPIGLHEFLYPLMVGYDSVALDVDVEIGGTEQTFNMLAGRTLMKKLKNKEKFVVSNKLLTDSSGKKLGKTEGNAINITDEPREQYGKIMALADDVIVSAFEMCTEVDLAEIEKIKKEINKGTNPRDLKMRLAREIVTIYHGATAAKEAEEYFVKTIQKGETPEDVKQFEVDKAEWNIIDLMVVAGFVKSKGEARRVINEGGVKIDGKVIDNVNMELIIDSVGRIIQKGKHTFVRVVFEI